MFKAWSTKAIEIGIHTGTGESLIIEPDHDLTIKVLEDGSIVGQFLGYSFDIFDDEYVKLTGIYSNLTH